MNVGDRFFILTKPKCWTFRPNDYRFDRETWVEYELVEDLYKLKDRYKVELTPLDPHYPKETFYYEDFVAGMVREDRIIKKTSDNQHVEFITWREALSGDAYLVHDAPFVVSETPLVTWIYGM